MSNPNLCGKKLRALRESMPSQIYEGKHMSQAEFAAWLSEKRGWHLTQSMICDWETQPRISAHTDRMLRDLLGMKKAKEVKADGS